MGQAKRRGTYEQRRTEAIARAKATQAEEDRLEDKRFIERQRIGSIGKRHSPLMVAMIAAAAMGMKHDR